MLSPLEISGNFPIIQVEICKYLNAEIEMTQGPLRAAGGGGVEFRGKITRLDRDGYGVVEVRNLQPTSAEDKPTAFFTKEVLAEKSLRLRCHAGTPVEGRMVPFGETFRVVHLERS